MGEDPGVSKWDVGEQDLISELVENQNLFDSSGYSVLKVTKSGVTKKLKLPIKSTGVAEFQAELSGKAPRPPVRFETIKKGSKEGQLLGLRHDRMVQIFDETDEAYINAFEEHNQNFIWRVVVFAIDLAWTKADGAKAKTFEEKRQILKTNGLTMHHATRIFRDVQNLTQLREDQEDFLPES